MQSNSESESGSVVSGANETFFSLEPVSASLGYESKKNASKSDNFESNANSKSGQQKT